MPALFALVREGQIRERLLGACVARRWCPRRHIVTRPTSAGVLPHRAG
jgi:hypothetical protein